jgi:alkylhydroperoxidase family enzyme
MARISLDPPRTLTNRVVAAYSRRTYGGELDPARAAGHHPRLLRSMLRNEMSIARWHALDERLKVLAVMASAVRIGCSWCVDFGYWDGFGRGVPAEVLRAVPQWRGSDLFSPVERRVMEYAEAMSATPPQVDDRLVADLRADLGEAALVELTMMVAVENQRSRFNAALGLAAQGFSDRCEVPAARP